MPEHMPAPTFSRAVYGFVLYLTLKTLFIIYLIWSFVPDSILNYINISYIPQKYWAISIPILCLNYIAIFAFFIYPGLNLCMTPSFNDLRTFTDKCAENALRKNIESTMILNKLEQEQRNKIVVNGTNSDKILLNGVGVNVPKKHVTTALKKSKNKCSCKSMKNCFKNNAKKMNNSNLYSNYSVPSVRDITMSDVCKNLYL